MCGITGFWHFQANQAQAELLNLVQKMALQLNTRGPDSSGTWADPAIGLAFGHMRLAIVDLTQAGHQPMVSHSGLSVITYNGEIYNAVELRQELITQYGCKFAGHSDTEVILEACEAWGVEQACKKFIGMFAFAYWHKTQQRLFLARDRLGIKPLYWGLQHGVLWFASQLKSFALHPKWKPTIDRIAMTNYFRFGYIPAPYSIYTGIYKLTPGSILTIDLQQQPKISKFWQLNPTEQIDSLSGIGYVNKLEQLLQDAVKRRMIADVPFGAFLSGGVDSSLVVALMQRVSSIPVKTFTIGFKETAFDEAPYAAAVAKHLGTEHHCQYLSNTQAQEIIPGIADWCDEPFADSSQIPTFLVSRLAREFVTVSLSGDGGDELFAGYNRYLQGQSIWRKVKYLPFNLRKILAKQIVKISPNNWDLISKIIPQKLRPRLFGDKVHKFATILNTNTQAEFYLNLVSQWSNPEALVLGSQEILPYPWDNLINYFAQQQDSVTAMQWFDTMTYLPDDILTKVDRASMAVSLEARVPLLDHRIVEFSYGLPLNLKIRHGVGKWLLRQVLYKYVPAKLIDRPKMGFGIPLDQWLRGPLRDWAENLLSRQRLQQEGWLQADLISAKWQEHLSGKRNWQYQLWTVLIFQAWLDRWR